MHLPLKAISGSTRRSSSFSSPLSSALSSSWHTFSLLTATSPSVGANWRVAIRMVAEGDTDTGNLGSDEKGSGWFGEDIVSLSG